MHDITPDAVVIEVDTHKDVHVAVAINGLGARLATASFPVTGHGYRQVATWAAEHGVVYAFGIEGTGSYGAGLTRGANRHGACASLRSAGLTGSSAAGTARPTPSMPSPPRVPSWRVTPTASPSSATAPSR